MIAVGEKTLEGFIEPLGRCLTPEVARKIVALRANRKTQERVDYLADKCSEGTLTPEERAEYESYVWASSFIAILQSKARKLLRQDSAAQ